MQSPILLRDVIEEKSGLPAVKERVREMSVAQSCTLLYRRIAFGWVTVRFERGESLRALRIANPRYGRLQVCATANCWRCITRDSSWPKPGNPWRLHEQRSRD